MDLRLFDPLLAARLDKLYRGARKALEQEELLKITPVAAHSVLLCRKADRELAARRVRERIAASGGQALRDRCPALAGPERLIRQNHAAMAEEFSRRFDAARGEIARELFGRETVSDPLEILAVGDVHNGGRQTLTVTVKEGKFLYKPHPCPADRALYDLVAAHFSDILAVPRCVDRGDHGFCEFIVSVPASTREEAALFYRRMGGLAALAHAIGISDLHCENVLVSGGMPVPVDMETLLTPRPPAGDFPASSAFREAFDRSVYPCCMLPCLQGGFQFSPLLSQGEQNRSMLVIDGRQRDVTGFEPDFLEGFLEGYDRCAGLKKELAAFVGRLGTAPVRQLILPTEEYARFMRRLNQPDRAQTPEAQEALLSRWIRGAANRPAAAGSEIARLEAESMRARDIPCFYTLGNSRGLYSGERKAADRYSDASGTEEALLRIGQLGPEDRAFEERIIRGAFSMALIPRTPPEPEAAFLPGRVLSREEALSAAGKILELLEEETFPCPGGQRNLLRQSAGLESFGPCGAGFGSGLGGILVFLTAAEKALGRVSPAARELRETFAEQTEQYLAAARAGVIVPGPGLSKGLGGLLTADLLTGGTLLSAPAKEAISDGIAGSLSQWAYAPAGMFDGTAGLVTALCRTADRMNTSRPAGQTKDPLPLRAAELLLKQTEGILPEKQTGPEPRKESPRARSGFGSGPAGIGAAMLAAYRYSSDPRFLRAAGDLFRAEHGLFTPALPGWPDLRRSPVPETDSCALAAGTPGVAMTLRPAAEAGLPGAREDLETALRVLKAKPLPFRDDLAEGGCGVAEAFLSLGEQDAAGRVLAAMLDRAGGVGGLRFTPPEWRPFRIPGLMDGLAGVGCVLLRYACPELLPDLFL